jgi:hypothetical protein
MLLRCVLQATGPDGKVCYYYNGDPRTIYERLVSSSSSSSRRRRSDGNLLPCTHARWFVFPVVLV